MTPEPFTVGDYLYAAQLHTGASRERLLATVPRDRLVAALYAPFAKIGGRLAHASLPEQAAVLAARLSGSRLLPAANSDVAVMAMVGFLAVNGLACRIGPEHDRAVALLERVVASELREQDFAAWVAERTFPDYFGEEDPPR